MDTQFTLERNHNVVQNDLESESVYFLSYNSTGFNSQRADFLFDICSQFGTQNCFLSVQEHWLLNPGDGGGDGSRNPPVLQLSVLCVKETKYNLSVL